MLAQALDEGVSVAALRVPFAFAKRLELRVVEVLVFLAVIQRGAVL